MDVGSVVCNLATPLNHSFLKNPHIKYTDGK